MRALAGRLFPLHDRRTVDVLNTEAAGDLKDEIARYSPDLVVVDVLARCHNANEQDSSMKGVMQSLRTITDPAASVIIHHTRKPGPEQGDRPQQAFDIRGSSAVHGEIDGALILSRRAGQGARYAITFSMRDVQTPDELLLDIAKDLTFVAAGGMEQDKLLAAWRDAFRFDDVLGTRVLQQRIGDALDVGARRARDYVHDLAERGLIKRQRGVKGATEYAWPGFDRTTLQESSNGGEVLSA
jgi:hypothetical protein